MIKPQASNLGEMQVGWVFIWAENIYVNKFLHCFSFQNNRMLVNCLLFKYCNLCTFTELYAISYYNYKQQIILSFNIPGILLIFIPSVLLNMNFSTKYWSEKDYVNFKQPTIILHYWQPIIVWSPKSLNLHTKLCVTQKGVVVCLCRSLLLL